MPPHISLAALRTAVGITADELCRRINEENPSLKPSRGTISAIEGGHRGPSTAMLAAICAAYGLPRDAIVTDYIPRNRDLGEAS